MAKDVRVPMFNAEGRVIAQSSGQSARPLRWPALCVCCCQPTSLMMKTKQTTFVGVSGATQQYLATSMKVPYCTACQHHSSVGGFLWTRIGLGLLLSIVVYFVLSLLLLFVGLKVEQAGPVGVITAIGFFFGICFWADKRAKSESRARMTANCSAPDRVAVLKFSPTDRRGSEYLFTFANEEYADLFLAQNR